MFYQLVILCCVAASVLAAPTEVVPLEKQQPTVIPIISQSEELEPNGTYKFSYETGNGIKREEISYDKKVPKAEGRSSGSNEGGESDESDEIHVQQGSYSYTAPDGTLITLRYIADENGFQAFGDHLPRAPAQAQISSSSAEKSGRALKNVDSAEAASAPVSAAKSESAPEPAKPAPEPAQGAPESNPATPGAKSTSTKVPAAPEQPASTQAAEQSSTTLPPESSTLGAEQPATGAVSDQSTTVAAEQSTINSAEQSSTAAASEASTATTDRSVPAVTAAEAAPAAGAEQPASSTVADQAPVSAEPNSAERAQQPASTTTSAQSADGAASTTISA